MADSAAHFPQQVKVLGDVASGVTVVATLLKWLPAIAAALSIVWTAIRIYETETVQALIKKWRDRKGPPA